MYAWEQVVLGREPGDDSERVEADHSVRDDQVSELLDKSDPMRDAPRINLDTHDWEVDQL